MRHLNSGEMILFNMAEDYQEAHDFAKVAQMASDSWRESSKNEAVESLRID